MLFHVTLTTRAADVLEDCSGEEARPVRLMIDARLTDAQRRYHAAQELGVPVDQIDEVTHALTFVNVYRITQAYGGPEEGGWYYDEGWPLASVEVNDEAALEMMRGAMRLLFPEDKRNTREHVRITVEDHFAAAFPTVRPHYE